MVGRQCITIPEGHALLHGRAGHTRTLYSRPEERLSAATHPRRTLSLSAGARNAVVQYECPSVAAAETARRDVITNGCKVHPRRARCSFPCYGVRENDWRPRETTPADAHMAADRHYFRGSQRLAVDAR